MSAGAATLDVTNVDVHLGVATVRSGDVEFDAADTNVRVDTERDLAATQRGTGAA